MTRFASVSFVLCFALFLLIAGVRLRAQTEERDKATNLKVLDTTITHDELISIMGDYTDALGVHCDYCHARKGGENSRDMDFASDQIPAKLAARSMIRMVNSINSEYIGKMKSLDTPVVKVQCVTCHRGQVRPELVQDVLKRALKANGMTALDSTYRSLRGKYYGSHTFDFSDVSLVHLAMEVSQASDSTALSILKLNKEFNPESAFNEWAIGQTLASLGDTTGAITALEHALQLNPNSRRTQRDLAALKAAKKP